MASRICAMSGELCELSAASGAKFKQGEVSSMRRVKFHEIPTPKSFARQTPEVVFQKFEKARSMYQEVSAKIHGENLVRHQRPSCYGIPRNCCQGTSSFATRGTGSSLNHWRKTSHETSQNLSQLNCQSNLWQGSILADLAQYPFLLVASYTCPHADGTIIERFRAYILNRPNGYTPNIDNHSMEPRISFHPTSFLPSHKNPMCF